MEVANNSVVGSSSKTKVLRSLTMVLALALSAAAGVYIGYSLSLRSALSQQAGDALNFFLKPGEIFPDYELWDPQLAISESVHTVDPGMRILLVFLNKHCGACWDLVDHWESQVMPDLSEDIRVLWIFDYGDWPLPELRLSQLSMPRCRVLLTYREEQEEEDGISLSPTSVWLDEDRKLKFVHYGYTEFMTASYIHASFDFRYDG